MRLIGPPAPAPRFATITQALKHAATTPSELVLLDVHEQACPISFEALLERAQWVA